VTYLRDVTGRIVQRTAHPVTGSDEVERYTYTGPGESAWGLLDATTNARIQRFVNLPGGATVSIDSGGVATWTFSGIHGDIIYKGNSASTRYTYDPFGQVIDSTGNLGTLTADDAGPNTLTGNADNGWAGPNRKLYEHQGSIATIEMGARQYVPGLGRFLETDPITGGNTSDYNYPNDPINGSDLTGKWVCPVWANSACNAVSNNPAFQTNKPTASNRGSSNPPAAKPAPAAKVCPPGTPTRNGGCLWSLAPDQMAKDRAAFQVSWNDFLDTHVIGRTTVGDVIGSCLVGGGTGLLISAFGPAEATLGVGALAGAVSGCGIAVIVEEVSGLSNQWGEVADEASRWWEAAEFWAAWSY
jgi:RHS repeat-associated protein